MAPNSLDIWDKPAPQNQFQRIICKVRDRDAGRWTNFTCGLHLVVGFTEQKLTSEQISTDARQSCSSPLSASLISPEYTVTVTAQRIRNPSLNIEPSDVSGAADWEVTDCLGSKRSPLEPPRQVKIPLCKTLSPSLADILSHSISKMEIWSDFLASLGGRSVFSLPLFFSRQC